MTIFEVRMPCYERPELVLRALRSLQAQTYPNWHATIYDDSRSTAVEAAVAGFSRSQITYVRNPKRLGAAFNIDQCFDPDAHHCGQYGCLLEDDNYWLPGFLELMASTVRQRQWDLILANQRIEDFEQGLLPPSHTTRGDWFHAGPVDPLDLRASLFFIEGLSNGGMVWKLGAGNDLRVGTTVREAGLHEACRSLLVSGTFLFVDDAQAVHTYMSKETTARSGEADRLISRGMQSVRSFALSSDGYALVERAKLLAINPERIFQLVFTLAYAGWPRWAGSVSSQHGFAKLTAVAKGLAVRVVQHDPCGTFLQAHRNAKQRRLRPETVPAASAPHIR